MQTCVVQRSIWLATGSLVHSKNTIRKYASTKMKRRKFPAWTHTITIAIAITRRKQSQRTTSLAIVSGAVCEKKLFFISFFWVVFTQLKTFLVLIFSSQEKRCKKSFQLWGPFFRVFYSFFFGQRKTPKTYSCSKPKRVFTFTTLLGARYLRLRYQYSILLQFCSTCIDCFMIWLTSFFAFNPMLDDLLHFFQLEFNTCSVCQRSRRGQRWCAGKGRVRCGQRSIRRGQSSI